MSPHDQMKRDGLGHRFGQSRTTGRRTFACAHATAATAYAGSLRSTVADASALRRRLHPTSKPSGSWAPPLVRPHQPTTQACALQTRGLPGRTTRGSS